MSGKVKGASTVIMNKNTKSCIKSINSKCMQNAINSKYDGHIIRNLHIF